LDTYSAKGKLPQTSKRLESWEAGRGEGRNEGGGGRLEAKGTRCKVQGKRSRKKKVSAFTKAMAFCRVPSASSPEGEYFGA